MQILISLIYLIYILNIHIFYKSLLLKGLFIVLEEIQTFLIFIILMK